jgi:hypothetical protein
MTGSVGGSTAVDVDQCNTAEPTPLRPRDVPVKAFVNGS